MGGRAHWWGRDSRAEEHRAGLAEGVAVDVPMATPAEDGHCVDGRVPNERDEEEGTWICWAKPAEFGFLGVF